MSYEWTGAGQNAYLVADLGSGNEINYSTNNIIVGFWFNYAADDSNDGFMSLGDDAAETTPQELSCVRVGSATIAQAGAENFLRIVRADGASALGAPQMTSAANTAYTGDGTTWNAALCVVRGAADCSIYLNTRTNVSSSTGNRDIIGTGLRRIRCGITFGATSGVQAGFGIAECFVGAITPTTGEIDDFFSGKSPGLVWPSLAFYDPMTDDTAFNTSKRIGPTPSVAGSTPTNTGLVAGHPTIDYGASLVKKLKILVHPDAASAASIEGIVWAAGGIAGAEYGEFTGKTFEATTEGSGDAERAVLKVPVADFGGGALNPDDVVPCLVRNATYTTGIVSGVVIEE